MEMADVPANDCARHKEDSWRRAGKIAVCTFNGLRHLRHFIGSVSFESPIPLVSHSVELYWAIVAII